MTSLLSLKIALFLLISPVGLLLKLQSLLLPSGGCKDFISLTPPVFSTWIESEWNSLTCRPPFVLSFFSLGLAHLLSASYLSCSPWQTLLSLVVHSLPYFVVKWYFCHEGDGRFEVWLCEVLNNPKFGPWNYTWLMNLRLQLRVNTMNSWSLISIVSDLTI